MNPAPPAKPPLAGIIQAILAYGSWGLLPLYWKQLIDSAPLEILCHRMVWSLVFVGILLQRQGRLGEAIALLRQPRLCRILLGTASLLSFNWGLYIYAVNSNQITQVSLGYYINPLVNVMVGFLFLGEPLSPLQGWAVGFAALGVLNQALVLGEFPWISLGLALSFASYALVRKLTPAPPLAGLAVETLLITPAAVAFLVYWQGIDRSTFGQSLSVTLWLLGAGIVTAMPLLWFNKAAKSLLFSTLGFLQYIGPSLQLAIGVFLYQEPFTLRHGVTFALIWLGLGLYSWSLVQAARSPATPP